MRSRSDQIDKLLAASRICYPNCKNYVPLILEELEKLYGESWRGDYLSDMGREANVYGVPKEVEEED